MKISILNIHRDKLEGYDLLLYCGRPYSMPKRTDVVIHNVHLGNPFPVYEFGDRALPMFNDWIDTIEDENALWYVNHIAKIRNRIKELEVEQSKEYKVALLCFCAPRPCHTEKIKELLLSE